MCYVLGFTMDPAIFSASFGCLMLCYPLWEDRQKLKSEQRLRQSRVDLIEWERQTIAAIRAAHLEHSITPGWIV